MGGNGKQPIYTRILCMYNELLLLQINFAYNDSLTLDDWE